LWSFYVTSFYLINGVVKIKSKIVVVCILIAICISVMGTAYGSFDIRKDTDLPLTEQEILDLIEKNTEPTNPNYLSEIQKYESLIAVYGIIPSKSGIEAYEWDLLLQDVARSIQKDDTLEKDMKAFGGSIIAYTVTNGYMSVLISKESDLSKEDLKRIETVFSNHALKHGVKDLPLIVIYSEEFTFTSSPIYTLPVSPDNSTYYKKEQPIIGGISVVSADRALGTLGYSVVKNNNASGTRGYITAGHLVPKNQVSTLYQPYQTSSSENSIGNANNNQPEIDVVYVVNSNVQPIIHVGEDPVLKNMTNRTLENKTKLVVYGSSSPSGEIRRYGGMTGNTGGYNKGYAYNITAPNIPGTIVYAAGIMNGTAATSGDSGGPVYTAMNLSIGNQRDYQAFIIGMTFANGTYQGEPVSLYAPNSEIDYYFGLKPYVITGKYLT
jgi:hypothetical protein